MERWVSRLFKTLNIVPMEAGGWHFKKFNCSENSKTCSVEWKNTGYGTFKSLNEAVDSLGSISLVNPSTAKQKIQIKDYSVTKFNETEIESHLANLPTDGTFQLEHVSVLQLLGSIPEVEYKINSPGKHLVLSQPHYPVQETITFPGLAKGSWSLKGKSIQILNDSVLKLDPKVFFARSLKLEITYNKQEINADWIMEGSYVSQG